jgi:hypothetical protein
MAKRIAVMRISARMIVLQGICYSGPKCSTRTEHLIVRRDYQRPTQRINAARFHRRKLHHRVSRSPGSSPGPSSSRAMLTSSSASRRRMRASGRLAIGSERQVPVVTFSRAYICDKIPA